MALVFEEIQDLYQRSIQPGSKVVFRTKYFIQKLLYAVDYFYYEVGHLAMTLADSVNKRYPTERFYIDIDDKWCETFIKYFKELRMKEIMLSYYEPIKRKQSKEYKCLLGKASNKAYTMIPSDKLYPKVFYRYLETHGIDKKWFIPETEDIPEAISFNITRDVNNSMYDQDINPRVARIMANIRYIPNGVFYNVFFIEMLANRYEPRFKHFLIEYMKLHAESIRNSGHELANIILHITTSNDHMDREQYARILKCWHKKYKDVNGFMSTRKICECDYLHSLVNTP